MKPHRNHGWIMFELITSMIILTLISALLYTTQGQHRRALAHLADSRAAAYLAEHALLDLQLGQPLPTTQPDSTISLRVLDEPSPLANQTWVALTAKINASQEQLVGLVPTSATRAHWRNHNETIARVYDYRAIDGIGGAGDFYGCGRASVFRGGKILYRYFGIRCPFQRVERRHVAPAN